MGGKEQLVLHDYQKRASEMVVNLPYCGLFLDMGLGKTAATLDAIQELYCRGQVGRVLIVAPKKVAQTTWQGEIEKWANFKSLTYSTIMGTAKQRKRAAVAPANIYIINRDNVVWLLDQFGLDKWPFDMIVLDESSSFKNPRAKRTKELMRVRKHKAKRLVLLTGTPSPNNADDLWAQIYLLDLGARLHDTFGKFQAVFQTKNPFTPFPDWKMKKGAADAIASRIQDICLSMKSEDYLKLPDKIVVDRRIILEGKARIDYDKMERDCVLSIEEQDITAASAAALTIKLQQLASGAVYDENGEFHIIHDAKLDMLEEMIEALGGEPVLVFYAFKHERDRILERLPQAVQYRDKAELEAWNDGKISVLIAHPASTAYGLNLQKGGHNIIWYAPTWNLEHYLQANARLHRQGQAKPVIIQRLICGKTKDEDVIRALESKGEAQEILLESLKATIRKYRGEQHVTKSTR